MHGVLVVDKPAGTSSAAAVDRVKRALGVDRAGHGGTLDPIATGVLAVCLGEATKLAQYFLGDDKAYEAEGRLGVETDTLDRTGAVVAEHAVSVTREAFAAALVARTGEHDQLPPMYSAIKQQGVRLYRRARAGEHVERVPRRIRIDRLELVAFEPPHFRIAIACSKGTYVRSLVADLGSDVGCGAHLTELRRTRSGTFHIADTVPLGSIGSIDLGPHLIPLVRATQLPIVRVEPAFVAQVHSGVQLPVETFGVELLSQFQLVDRSDRLLAIAHSVGGRIVYDRVFAD